MTEPKIFTKNYVNAADSFAVSHGSTSRPYLHDRDNDTKWQSVGANSDATAVTIDVTFYEGTVAVNRTIDRLAIINHNLKTWTLYQWTGSAWAAVTSEAADAAANTIKSFAAVTTSKVRLEATATQVTNAEKVIGEMIVCALRLDIGQDWVSSDFVYRSNRMKEVVLADGSVHQFVTRFSNNRTHKYEARPTFRYLSKAVHDSLLAIKQEGTAFLWQPESAERPDQFFYVHWVGGWSSKYVTGYKASGYEVRMELKEV